MSAPTSGRDSAGPPRSSQQLWRAAEELFEFRLAGKVNAERMIRAQVGLDRGEMIRDLVRVFLRVGLPAAQAIFFIHPGDDTDRAPRMQAELLDKIRHLHRDGHARSIVDRAGAEIPGIEMPGNDDDLLGMLAAFQVADNVVAHRVRQLLRG